MKPEDLQDALENYIQEVLNLTATFTDKIKSKDAEVKDPEAWYNAATALFVVAGRVEAIRMVVENQKEGKVDLNFDEVIQNYFNTQLRSSKLISDGFIKTLVDEFGMNEQNFHQHLDNYAQDLARGVVKKAQGEGESDGTPPTWH